MNNNQGLTQRLASPPSFPPPPHSTSRIAPPSFFPVQSPPAPKIALSPQAPSKPSTDYLLHLIPHPSIQLNRPIPPFPQSQSTNSPSFINSGQQNRQFIENTGNDVRSNRSDSEVFLNGNSQGMSMFNRSKGFSEFNPRLESQVRGKSFAYQTDYKTVQSPVKIIGPAQNKVSFSVDGRKSNRSSSQHNIHITIESNNEGEAAPTITINPNNSKVSQPAIYTQNRVVNFPPPPMQVISRPTSISQTIISHQPPQIPQPMIVNQPPTIINHRHPPILFQSPIISPKEGQQQVNLASYSCQSTAPVLNSESLRRQKHSPLSTTGEFSRQSKGKKLSIETAARHEYYNQAEILERQDDSLSSSAQPRNTLNAYIHEQKFFLNSRLLDEIFENETHRALLQMCELDSRSRDRTSNRHHSRQKKSRL